MATRHKNSNLLWEPCICGYDTPGTIDSPVGLSMGTTFAVDGLARPIIIVGGSIGGVTVVIVSLPLVAVHGLFRK